MKRINKLKILFLALVVSAGINTSVSTKVLGQNQKVLEADQDTSLNITKLPFGCSTFYNSNFPPSMVHPELRKESGRNNKLVQKKQSQCRNFVSKIRDTTAKDFFKKVNNAEYFLYDKASKKNGYQDILIRSRINDSLLKIIDSIRFRLPNIGNHQVYFSTGFDLYKRFEGWKEKIKPRRKVYGSGNLIIYDPENQNVKVINIYRHRVWHRAESGVHRYFFIKNYDNIYIYNIVSSSVNSALLPSVQKVSLKYDSTNSTVKVHRKKVFSH